MNGNLTSATCTNAALAVTECWRYEWNPRDQLTRAEKYTGPGSGDFAGAVEYSWCLSCDSALSERREYDAAGECISWQRYEYDGLQLLRRDERYDADADGLPYLDSNGVPDSGDSWRVVEAVMHRPGSLAHQLAKRVWVYSTNQTGYPSSRPVYVYQHDAIGNVWLVLEQDGVDMELFCEFSQDAYGNPLVADGFTGTDWTTARADGVTEHQTGKWIDPFSGLHFFHARWYDSETGRFISKDPITTPIPDSNTCCQNCSTNPSSMRTNSDLRRRHQSHYLYCLNQPTAYYDPDGKIWWPVIPGIGYIVGVVKCAVEAVRILETYKELHDGFPHDSFRHCYGGCIFCQ